MTARCDFSLISVRTLLFASSSLSHACVCLYTQERRSASPFDPIVGLTRSSNSPTRARGCFNKKPIQRVRVTSEGERSGLTLTRCVSCLTAAAGGRTAAD